MKDQYDFLKAIDTSSSSPELLQQENAPPLGSRKRSDKRTCPPATTSSNSQTASQTSSTSSSSARANPKTQPATGLKGKLQNLVAPIKFTTSQQASAASKPGSKRPEPDEPSGSRGAARLFSLTSKSNGESKRKQVPTLLQSNNNNNNHISQLKPRNQLVMAPNLNPRPSSTAHQQLRRIQAEQPHHQNHLSLAAVATGSGAAPRQVGQQNYLPSESPAKSAVPRRHQEPEIARCYDEIDQIYDYIRGLAPLPANLRKIKSIDFEQLERERQKMAEKQQQQQQQQIQAQQVQAQAHLQAQQVQHHKHRQRFVRSIDDSTTTSHSAASSATTTATPPSGSNRRLVKVRQRSAAELLKGDDQIKPPPSQQSTSASYVVALPQPIRVTAMSAESSRPSIKRVESLNLGQREDRAGTLPSTCRAPTARLSPHRAATQQQQQQQQSLTQASLTKPNYLISTTQRGQVFRLPRAHSTSTLSKPSPQLIGLSASRRAAAGPSQPAMIKQPAIPENLPLARLANGHQSLSTPTATGSLGRSVGSRAFNKRPSFESDLVESFVDDDDDEPLEVQPRCQVVPVTIRGTREVATRESTDSSSSASSSTSSTSGRDAKRPVAPGSSSSTSDATSERLSQKSHSDYENDSATSETTTDDDDEDDEDKEGETSSSSSDQEEGEEQEREARGESLKRKLKGNVATSPFSGPSSTSGITKRSQTRPTTSSSPSSGRPASLADETNESDEADALLSPRGQISSEARGQAMQLRRVPPREEHIYEQIPAHKTHLEKTQQQVVGPRRASDAPKFQSADTATGLQAARRASHGHSAAALPSQSKQTPQTAHKTTTTTKHPVAYAANVAVNRRYQQQVAALFALQQQRDRHLACASRRASDGLHMSPAAPLPLAQIYHQGHQRRASASNPSQFLAPQPWRHNGAGSTAAKHQQQQLASVPHRHRLSMGNLHLLSQAIPLASLYSPKREARNVGPTRTAKEPPHRSQNTNSLDDHEAGSTGTTNSTSSYEAAIKNSDPNPLRVDHLLEDDSSTRHHHPGSRRSLGSGSGSRSLTNHMQAHSNHHLHHNHHHHHQQQHQPQQQSHQTSTLVKVPKLSKQSHLLQRPLPKPPNYHSRSSNPKPVKSTPGENRLIRDPIVGVYD